MKMVQTKKSGKIDNGMSIFIKRVYYNYGVQTKY